MQKNDLKFSSYSDIFTLRGAQYQAAMQRWPDARGAEFQQIIQDAQLAPDLLVYDAPAGGGYLARYIHEPLDLIEVETTAGFTGEQPEDNSRLLCTSLDAIPLGTASADRIISLAGLHHVYPRTSIYQEFARLLRPGGLLAMADVAQGSFCDTFLNEFVPQYCPSGHLGRFFDAELPTHLRACGLLVQADRRVSVSWRFASKTDMADFCRLLFGLDLADRETTLAGIRNYLGYEEQGDHVLMNWELRYVQALKL